MKLSASLAICIALVLAACGSDPSTETRGDEAAARAKPAVPKGPSSKSLVVKDLIEGTGTAAEDGDQLAVHYVAGIYETGEEIESAWVRGEPLGFDLGSGSWMKGWEEGMPGMRVGGRRELIFPTTPADAPPGSELGDTLVYVVDLLAVTKPSGSS
jgi:peptidylprolyl isomerase